MERRTKLLRIIAHDGLKLGLWELAPIIETKAAPVLLVHGATYGAVIFDLDKPGYSLMADLASTGRYVYALDVRGYGASGSTPAMDASPELNPPFARASEAALDIRSAVEFICRQRSVNSLDVIGFSWGTVTASLFAQTCPALVRRLALYAPLFGERNELWRKRIGSEDDQSILAERYGAYRQVTLQDTLRRWNEDLPVGDASAFREEGIAELLFHQQSALDPKSLDKDPSSFRCPNGALADLIGIFNGQPCFDAAKLTMPMFLVRGEHDTTSTAADARRLLSLLGAADKTSVEIPGGSHFLFIERNRSRLYAELRDFLRQ
jgi:pimeloyl-ACP methyl ester carboxylesterase